MAAIAKLQAELPLIVVAGPTASGKSELSLHLASALRGEVLSIDSVQVFRGLDIGSAKIERAARERVPHHGLDILDPNESFNVADFLKFAEATLAELAQRKVPVIACAGTTLYLTALLHGLVEAPKADPALRAELAKLSERTLYERLVEVDPAAAQRLHPHDRLRVSRALEAALNGRIPLSSLHAAHGLRAIRHRALVIVLCWSRDVLYARINQRSKHMLDAGLVEEVRSIRQRFPQAEHALRTLGYAQAAAFLEGKLPESTLESQIAMETRRYAKRQTTYWKNEPRKRGWTITRGAQCENEQSQPPKPRVVQDLRGADMNWNDLLHGVQQVLESPQFNIELWYVDAAQLFESLPPLSLGV